MKVINNTVTCLTNCLYERRYLNNVILTTEQLYRSVVIEQITIYENIAYNAKATAAIITPLNSFDSVEFFS